jgi:hypothetical protein
MPSSSVEPRQSMTTTVVMLIMIFTSVIGLMWCLKKGIEESFPPKHKIEIKK